MRLVGIGVEDRLELLIDLERHVRRENTTLPITVEHRQVVLLDIPDAIKSVRQMPGYLQVTFPFLVSPSVSALLDRGVQYRLLRLFHPFRHRHACHSRGSYKGRGGSPGDRTNAGEALGYHLELCGDSVTKLIDSSANDRHG